MTVVRVAVAQVGTILYDTPATVDLLEKKARDAAENGAKLVLFPEAFIGGYPKLESFGCVLGKRTQEGREEFKKYYDSAIEEHDAESIRISDLAKELDIHIVTGAVEREGGTLYCTVFFFGPSGYLGKHRKLLPTALERCVWGNGDGSTMPVIPTSVGKMGAAVCWENYMPLYRTHLYSKGIELYLAPTVDDRDVWLPTMQTIALEGRCFVISAVQFLKGKNYPEGHKIRVQNGDEQVLIRGGSCVVDPLGTVLVQPTFNVEQTFYADLDFDQITRGKFDLDVVGHYARPDVFQLHVNTSSRTTTVYKEE